jgi:hypothetical protein
MVFDRASFSISAEYEKILNTSLFVNPDNNKTRRDDLIYVVRPGETDLIKEYFDKIERETSLREAEMKLKEEGIYIPIGENKVYFYIGGGIGLSILLIIIIACLLRKRQLKIQANIWKHSR